MKFKSIFRKFKKHDKKNTLNNPVVTSQISSQIPTTTPISPQIKSPTPISPQIRAPTPISPQIKSPTPISPQIKSPTPISPQIKSPTPISPQIKSPTPISPQIKSPTPISPQIKSPTPISPQIKSLTPTSPQIKSNPISPQIKSPTPISSQIKSPTPISPQNRTPKSIHKSSQIPIPIPKSQISMPTSISSSISTPISSPNSSPLNSPSTISPTICYPIQPIDFPIKRQNIINNYNINYYNTNTNISNSDVFLNYNSNNIYNNRKYSNSSSASSNSLYISFPPPPTYKNIQSSKRESYDLNQDSVNTSIASTIPSPSHREPYLSSLVSPSVDIQKNIFQGKIFNNELIGTSPNETLNSHAITLVNSNDGGNTDFTLKNCNSSNNPSAVTLHKDDSEVSEDLNNYTSTINGNIRNLEKEMYRNECLSNERIYYSNVNNIEVPMIHSKLQKSSTSLPINLPISLPVTSPINSPSQYSPPIKSPSEKKKTHSIFNYLKNKKDKKKEKELKTVYTNFNVMNTTTIEHEGLIAPGNQDNAVYNLWEQRNSDIKKRNSEITNSFNFRRSSISPNLSLHTPTSIPVLNSPNIESPKTLNNIRPPISPYYSYNRSCRNSNININDSTVQHIHPKSYLFNFPLPTPKSKISTLELDSGKSCVSNSSTNRTVISSPDLKLELPRRRESLYNEVSKNLPGRRISYPIFNPNVLQTSPNPNSNSLNSHSNSIPVCLSKEKCSCNETVKLNASTENTSLAKETKSPLIKNHDIKKEKENVKRKAILQNKKEEIRESPLPHEISEPNPEIKKHITTEITTTTKESHVPHKISEPNTEIKTHAVTETITKNTELIKPTNVIDSINPSLKYNLTPNSSKKSTLENTTFSKNEKLKNNFNQLTDEEISIISKRSSNSNLNNSYSCITESSKDLDLLYSYYQNSTSEANKKVMKQQNSTSEINNKIMKQEDINKNDVESNKPINTIKELKKPDIYKSLLNKRSSGILKNKNSYSIIKNLNSNNIFLYNNIPSSSNKSDLSNQSFSSIKSNKVNFCESKNLYRNITINKNNNNNLRPLSIGSNSIPFIVEKSLNQTTILNESSVKFDTYNTTESFSVLKGNFDESLNSNIYYSESEIIFEDLNFSKDIHSLYSFNISYDGDGGDDGDGDDGGDDNDSNSNGDDDGDDGVDIIENQEKGKTDHQFLNNKTNSSSSSNEYSVNQSECSSNDDEEISEFFKSHSGNRTSFIVIGKENENNINQNNSTQNSKVAKRESQCSNKLPSNILTSLNSNSSQDNISNGPSSSINENTELLNDRNASSISSSKTEPYIKSTAFIDDSKSKIKNVKYKSTGDLDTNKDFNLLDLDLYINLDLNFDINNFNKEEEKISSDYYDINSLKIQNSPKLDKKQNNDVPHAPNTKNVSEFQFNEIKKLINEKRNSNEDISSSTSSSTEKERSDNHIKFNDHEIKKLKNQKRESKILNLNNLKYENSNNNTIDNRLSLQDTTFNCKKNDKSSRISMTSISDDKKNEISSRISLASTSNDKKNEMSTRISVASISNDKKNEMTSIKSNNNMYSDDNNDNLIKESNNIKPLDNFINNNDNTYINYRNSNRYSPVVTNQVVVATNDDNNNIASKSKDRLSIIVEEPTSSSSIIQSKLYKNKGKRKPAIILPRNDSLKILEDQYFKEKIDNDVVFITNCVDNKGRKNIKSQCHSNIQIQNDDIRKTGKNSNNMTAVDDNTSNVSNNNNNEKYLSTPKTVTSPTIKNSYKNNNIIENGKYPSTLKIITSPTIKDSYENNNIIEYGEYLSTPKVTTSPTIKNSYENKTKSPKSPGNNNLQFTNRTSSLINPSSSHLFFNKNALRFNQALNGNKNQALNDNKIALKFNQTANDNKFALKFNQTLNDNKNALNFNQTLDDNKNALNFNQTLDNNKNALKFNQTLNNNKNALKFNQTANDNKNAKKYNQTVNDNKNAFSQALNDNINKKYQSIPKESGSSTTINNKRENKTKSQNNNNIKFTNRTSSLINPTSLPSPLLFSKNVLKVRQEGIPAMKKISSKATRISSSLNANNQNPNSRINDNNDNIPADKNYELEIKTQEDQQTYDEFYKMNHNNRKSIMNNNKKKSNNNFIENIPENSRIKKEREKMKGHKCELCQKFYDCVNENEDVDFLCQECSRHRTDQPINKTPQGFYDLNI